VDKQKTGHTGQGLHKDTARTNSAPAVKRWILRLSAALAAIILR